MAALLLTLLFCFLMIYLVSPEEVIQPRPGDDVILPCHSADPNITAVEWTRSDLKSKNVFLSTDGHFNPEEQHPSFKGRVQLVDRDLKDGDVSLILKNMKSSDEGTYECRVKEDGSTGQKGAILKTKPIRRIRLEVAGADHGDKEDGVLTHKHFGLTAALSLVCSSLVGLFLVMKSKRRLNKKPEAPAADEAERVELNM